MSTPSYSIIRNQQYEELKKVSLSGTVLDIGGSRKSGYQELVGGEHTWTVANYGDMHPGEDLNFNAEEKFPLEDKSYDNVVTMNVIEHIFDTHNLFAEVARVIKPGGLFVSSVPYMHHIHGSPDDYVRYTESAYRKFAERYGFEIVEIKILGYGLFSLMYQNVGGWFYFSFLKLIMKNICILFDKVLQAVPQYKKLSANIPLGYFWTMRKK